jgi:hypothetical protein
MAATAYCHLIQYPAGIHGLDSRITRSDHITRIAPAGFFWRMGAMVMLEVIPTCYVASASSRLLYRIGNLEPLASVDAGGSLIH